jgi:biofilm PGA synthesis protein PgaD
VALTVVLWAVYFVLSGDFFLFIGEAFFWAIGLGPTPSRLIPVLNLLPTIGSYAVVAVFNAAALMAWALYNQMRFRGKERRKASPRVTVGDFARMYGVSAAEVAAWQDARVLIVHHDDSGRLVGVDLAEGADASVGVPERPRQLPMSAL